MSHEDSGGYPTGGKSVAHFRIRMQMGHKEHVGIYAFLLNISSNQGNVAQGEQWRLVSGVGTT